MALNESQIADKIWTPKERMGGKKRAYDSIKRHIDSGSQIRPELSHPELSCLRLLVIICDSMMSSNFLHSSVLHYWGGHVKQKVHTCEIDITNIFVQYGLDTYCWLIIYFGFFNLLFHFHRCWTRGHKPVSWFPSTCCCCLIPPWRENAHILVPKICMSFPPCQLLSLW